MVTVTTAKGFLQDESKPDANRTNANHAENRLNFIGQRIQGKINLTSYPKDYFNILFKNTKSGIIYGDTPCMYVLFLKIINYYLPLCQTE